MIHAMPKRIKYVEDYLVPSMIQQGIKQEDITVYNDTMQEGNLLAWINSIRKLPDDGDTWHLQDDVIISSTFKTVTEALDYGIVCGFKSSYDGDRPYGVVKFEDSWFSFLCIHIPNKIAKECASWIQRDMIGNPVYRQYWEKGVNDDWFFRMFMNTYYKDEYVLNLKPNIVDHIDYLIGGTVNSSARPSEIRSKHWEEEYLVEQLKEKLNAST